MMRLWWASSAIDERGGKARAVTVSETWVSMLLLYRIRGAGRWNNVSVVPVREAGPRASGTVRVKHGERERLAGPELLSISRTIRIIQFITR